MDNNISEELGENITAAPFSEGSDCEADDIIVIIISVVLIMAIITENIMILCCLSNRPSLSQSSGLLYTSLAGSDILLCLLCIMNLLRSSSVLLSFLTSLFSLTSLASVAAIPADKAISLGCPFQYHNIVTRLSWLRLAVCVTFMFIP